MPYSLKGARGVPLYAKDYSTLATGGLTGNLAVTYLGSYKLKYSVKDVDWKRGTATISIHVENSSNIASATHPPIVGYTRFWNDYIGRPLNKSFEKGPLSEKIQISDWNESIKFNACKCRKRG